MHHFKRLLTAIVLTVVSLILLFSAVFAYLIVTPLGGKILVRYFKQQFAAMALMHVGQYQGTLQDGFILKDIRIVGLSYLPDAVVRIQQVHVRIPLWDWRHSDLTIFNARISIPFSDPVVFTGKVYAGQINGNLYARSVDIHAASRFWIDKDLEKDVRGFVSNIDLTIQGPLSSPVVSGVFLADGIQYKSMFLTDGKSHLNLTLVPGEKLQVAGLAVLDSGTLVVRHINLKLARSTLLFQGDVFNPVLDIHGGSRVEDTDIHLAVKGPMSKPQLVVTSDPPMPPEDALAMLFTGGAWTSTSLSPISGASTYTLAQDFLNYSLEDSDEQRIGLKKKLTNNLKLGVEMEQMPSLPGDTATYYSRKIEGEMDMNEHMSLNVSQQVLSQDRESMQVSQEPQPDEEETEIYLQYKKRF